MAKTKTPAPVLPPLDLPYTHRFVKPFVFGSETHTEIVISDELTGGALFEVMNEENQGDQTLRLISELTGWPDPKVKALPAREIIALAGVANRFLPAGPGTGK
jgi:hypothetical protein